MKFRSIAVLLLCASLLGACGSRGTKEGGADDSGSEAKPKEPFTLKFWAEAPFPQLFKEQLEGPIKEKFPYISFEYVSSSLDDLIASGNTPDLYYQGIAGAQIIIDHGMNFSLDPLIQQRGFDLKRIDPSGLELLRNETAGKGGGLIGIPGFMESPVLIYNKDVFDKFGIAYPSDGMSWDDAYQLARQLTRTDNEVQYRGMAMNINYMLANNQLGLSYYAKDKNEANVNTDGWKSIFSNMARFYEFPMSKKLDARTNVKERDDFMVKRTVAMYAAVTSAIDSFPADFSTWDVVSMPTMKEAPNANIQANTRYFFISSSNLHKEDTLDVLNFLLSDSVQTQQNRRGKGTVLVNNEIKRVFGQDDPKWKGKNVNALYKLGYPKPAEPRSPGLIALPNATNLVSDSLNSVILGQKDVNTALRELQEQMNREIAKAKP